MRGRDSGRRADRSDALVTALSAARLAADLRVAYWDHDQVDRQLAAADALLGALDPQEVANRITNA